MTRNNSIFKRPVLIAGPCSAETEQQVMDTATQLQGYNNVIFRAGVWKPRTRPESFEGMGPVAFPWLKKVQGELGMRVAVEVGNAQHAEAAIKEGMDVLWIGARTTVNPFTVQEIADAIQGANVPVMVKNPVSPDLGLWMGAIERVEKSGAKDIAAIHRGFTTYEKNKYRNRPMWEIPIELNRRNPNLPLICDPSHITGNSKLVEQVAQIAIDLNYEGLMIEVHPDPSNALSDPEQQLLPAQLKDLLDRLILRRPEVDDAFARASLEALRENIDAVDGEVLDLLLRRMEIVEEIGQFKKENDITILQPERWNEIIRSRLGFAKEHGLSEQLVFDLIEAIHKASIKTQTEIVSHGKETEKDQSL